MRRHLVSILIVFSFLFVVPFMTYDLWGESALAGVVMQKVNTYRLNQGLVGWWTFDGTDVSDKVYDRSGQGNHGYFEGGATSSAKTIGKVGQALQFDGVDDRVDAGDIAVLDGATKLTIAAWMKRGSPNSNVTVQKSGLTGRTGINMYLDGNVYLNLCDDGLCGKWGSFANNDTEWHYIVYVYDGSGAANADKLKAYLDGGNIALSFTGTIPNQTYNSSDHFFAGFDQANGNYTHGQIDDVRVYNRALSASEVKLLYTSTAGSKMNTSKNVIPGSTLQTGLVGLWSFDGPDVQDKVYDRSGQGNHGYFQGGATSSAKTIGKVGQALRFDGVNDQIEVLNESAFDFDRTSPFSISLWARPDSINTTKYFISKQQPSGNFPGWGFYWSSVGEVVFDLFGITGGCGTDCIKVVSPSLVVETKEWQHFVVTYDGSSLASGVHIYKDGSDLTLGVDKNGLVSSPVNNTPLDIGFNPSSGESEFPGALDDVRIYNRALSASEVKLLYTATAGTKVNTSQNVVPGSSLQNGLVGLWSFNGPDINSRTNKVLDRSGQGNDGEMVSMSTSTSRVAGKVGQALQFDGNDDSIVVANESAFDFDRTSPFSISLWARPDSMSGFFLSKLENGGNFPGWEFGPYSGGEVRFTMKGTTGVYPANLIGVSGPISIEIEKWQHFVATYDGSSNASGVHLYLDATEQSPTIWRNDLTSSPLNNTPLYIGDNPASGGGEFPGTLDEVRIYNRALTPAEVKLLYNLGR